MIKAYQARERVYAQDMEAHFKNQIESAIMQGIAANLLHCDWYTDAGYNCTLEDTYMVQQIVAELQQLGYIARMNVFEPNDTFNNRRIKLHINWE